MGKNRDIDELTNLMSKALRHKIGYIVNKDGIYAGKYAKDAEKKAVKDKIAQGIRRKRFFR